MSEATAAQEETAGDSCCGSCGTHAAPSEQSGSVNSTSTYTVQGMTCGHCVQSVTEEISHLEGVRSVDVELESGRVTVTSDASIPVESVKAAVDEAGYTLVTG